MVTIFVQILGPVRQDSFLESRFDMSLWHIFRCRVFVFFCNGFCFAMCTAPPVLFFWDGDDTHKLFPPEKVGYPFFWVCTFRFFWHSPIWKKWEQDAKTKKKGMVLAWWRWWLPRLVNWPGYCLQNFSPSWRQQQEASKKKVQRSQVQRVPTLDSLTPNQEERRSTSIPSFPFSSIQKRKEGKK